MIEKCSQASCKLQLHQLNKDYRLDFHAASPAQISGTAATSTRGSVGDAPLPLCGCTGVHKVRLVRWRHPLTSDVHVVALSSAHADVLALVRGGITGWWTREQLREGDQESGALCGDCR
jgi:hypothetical protein